MAVRAFERAPLLLLLDERLREPIARAELHGAQHRLGLGLSEVVVLKEAVAVLVEEPAALRAGGLGDQDPGEGQAGGMVLDELHVFERRARAIRQGHAVAVLDVGVGREGKDLAAAARAEDDGLGRDDLDLPGGERSEEHTSELQSPCNLVCRLLLEKKKQNNVTNT